MKSASVKTPPIKAPSIKGRRRAAALLTALFVMTVTSTLVITMLDTQTLQFAAMRNTIDWDRARYLAEAGIQHALAELEANIDWRTGVTATQFPFGSGNTYTATAVDGANGTVVVTATGTAGNVTRRLQITVKQGG
jgi:type II secretory pathway component PulK